MKTIFFVRHSKAIHDNITADFQRCLEERGKNDAVLMATKLKAMSICPDKIIASSAKRTVQTAKIFAKFLGVKKKIKEEPKLYATTPEAIIEVINAIKNKHNSVMIVAHNNEIAEVCELLSSASIANFPTSGVYAISFETDDFASIKAGSGKTMFFDYPKNQTLA